MRLMTMTVPLCNNSLLHPRCCRSSPIHYLGRRACHPKRGHKGGCQQHYSCWQWNCWNRWGEVFAGLGERIHWHQLSQWSWWRTFCREPWCTRWSPWTLADHKGSERGQWTRSFSFIKICVEASNVINDPKSNKGPKCNSFSFLYA